jgi:hypothetical protein
MITLLKIKRGLVVDIFEELDFVGENCKVHVLKLTVCISAFLLQDGSSL